MYTVGESLDPSRQHHDGVGAVCWQGGSRRSLQYVVQGKHYWVGVLRDKKTGARSAPFLEKTIIFLKGGVFTGPNVAGTEKKPGCKVAALHFQGCRYKKTLRPERRVGVPAEFFLTQRTVFPGYTRTKKIRHYHYSI